VGSLPRLDVFEHTHSCSFSQLENMHEYITRVVVNYLLNHDRGMQHYSASVVERLHHPT
jgi:hypothetical protein